MELGRGFTAARQQASRLAGLVCSPCLLNRKDRRRATGPPARNKGKRDSMFTLAFCVAEMSKLYRSIPISIVFVGTSPAEKENSFVSLCCEASPAASKHPKRRYLSLPSATCGGAERR